jgi:hypothetical protein
MVSCMVDGPAFARFRGRGNKIIVTNFIIRGSLEQLCKITFLMNSCDLSRNNLVLMGHAC